MMLRQQDYYVGNDRMKVSLAADVFAERPGLGHLGSAEEQLPHLTCRFPLTSTLSRQGRGRLFFRRSLVSDTS